MDQFEQAPMGGGMGGVAREKVQTPALLLMIVGGIYILLGLCGFGSNVLTMTGLIDTTSQQLYADPQMAQYANASSGVMGLITAALGMALGGLMIYGGMQMKELQNHSLALAGAVAGMLPCSLCCIFGLPVGVYALVVLLDDQVKQAFKG